MEELLIFVGVFFSFLYVPIISSLLIFQWEFKTSLHICREYLENACQCLTQRSLQSSPKFTWACFFPLNSNSHSLGKEGSSHTVLETQPWWFLPDKLDDSGLFSTQAFSCAQLSTAGRASRTSKDPLLFLSLFLFLMASEIEERMLSNSGKLMILSFFIFGTGLISEAKILFFPYGIFSVLFVCLLVSLQGPRCRYAIGRILSEGEDEADEKLLQRCQGLGFNVFSFPEAAHVVTTSLHHRTVFSVPVGVGRVYPKLERYIKVPLSIYLLLRLLSVDRFYCTMIQIYPSQLFHVPVSRSRLWPLCFKCLFSTLVALSLV